MDAVNYITGYTTKHETSSKQSLISELNGALVTSSDIFKICVDLLRKREVGMMEIVDMLMEHSLRETDTGCVFVNTNAEPSRQRILKPMADLEEAREAQEDDFQVYRNNWNDQYYPLRPTRLENYSFFNLRIYFQKVGKEAAGQDIEESNEVSFKKISFNYQLTSR